MEKANLTVGELIKTLQEYDPNSFVAIEAGGFAPPQTTALMSKMGYISGEFFVLSGQRAHKEYYLEEDIPERKRRDYIKCLVLNAHLAKGEK